jgi:hypothetical protein
MSVSNASQLLRSGKPNSSPSLGAMYSTRKNEVPNQENRKWTGNKDRYPRSKRAVSRVNYTSLKRFHF